MKKTLFVLLTLAFTLTIFGAANLPMAHSGSMLKMVAIDVKAPEGISFELPAQTQVIVSGIDKEVVGQVAANIRSLRKPEPYKGKGVRYLGERVVRKAGKAGKK